MKPILVFTNRHPFNSRIGDNNWPNELHLGDVIEKHILRHTEPLA